MQAALMAPDGDARRAALRDARALIGAVCSRARRRRGGPADRAPDRLDPGARAAGLAGAARAGELRLLVGTHALIQETVAFERLGLAVVDEQHRFGVRQRTALDGKARAT